MLFCFVGVKPLTYTLWNFSMLSINKYDKKKRKSGQGEGGGDFYIYLCHPLPAITWILIWMALDLAFPGAHHCVESRELGWQDDREGGPGLSSGTRIQDKSLCSLYVFYLCTKVTDVFPGLTFWVVSIRVTQ